MRRCSGGAGTRAMRPAHPQQDGDYMNMTLNEAYMKVRLRRAGWMQAGGVFPVIGEFRPHPLHGWAGFAITCRETKSGDRWTQRLPWLERLARLGEPGLGNPSQAVERKVAKVNEWLAAQELGREVPVRGLVVFRNPKTQLNVEGSSVE